MTTKVWQGQAKAVAQVDKIAVSAYDAATQYQLKVNGEIIVATSGKATTAATAAALASGWNAVTGNPYAYTITALATGSDVQLTADVAGNPFTVAGAVTGGTGTIGSATGVTSNESPHDWANVKNWAPTGVPVAADDVVFRDSSSPVLWGLAQSGVTLTSLVIEQSYTGTIGLNKRQFVTGSAGEAATGRAEYRADYLDIGWDAARLGENFSIGTAAGSQRLKLDNAKAGSSTTTVFQTASSSVDANQPAVRLLFANAGADLLVRSGAGGVGVAVDDAGETSTVGDVSVSDPTTASRVFLGEGVTLTNFTQDGGENVVRAAAAVTAVSCYGGILNTEGSGWSITTLNAKGGTVYANHTPTGGNAIGTIALDGGTVDGTQSREARTWGTVNLGVPGSSLRADDDVVTITTLNEPDGPYGLQIV
jgi:trimeric autotransporter adhesin